MSALWTGFEGGSYVHPQPTENHCYQLTVLLLGAILAVTTALFTMIPLANLTVEDTLKLAGVTLIPLHGLFAVVAARYGSHHRPRRT